MDRKRIDALIKKYYLKQCSKEEEALVEAWYDDFIKSEITDLSEELIKEDLENIYNRQLSLKKSRSIKSWLPVAASIIVVFSLALGSYFYIIRHKPAEQQIAKNRIKNEVITEKDNSFLVLEDGSKFFLDQAPIGEIATIGGVTITKVNEGTISYTRLADSKKILKSVLNNILVIPKGGQYQIILIDGTKIWMNAASTLKFPSSFAGSSRAVRLTGEGYFEVSENKLMPFKVVTGRQEVHVLGTHFNINSYSDEPTTKTTLIEGKVKVKSNNSKNNVVLKPGEQSIIDNDEKINVLKVDTEDVLAWRSGLFQFENSDLKFVTRQMARWYDVNFEIAGKVPETKLWGEFHRNDNLEKALELLTFFDFDYNILKSNGVKKVIITAKK